MVILDEVMTSTGGAIRKQGEIAIVSDGEVRKQDVASMDVRMVFCGVGFAKTEQSADGRALATGLGVSSADEGGLLEELFYVVVLGKGAPQEGYGICDIPYSTSAIAWTAAAAIAATFIGTVACATAAGIGRGGGAHISHIDCTRHQQWGRNVYWHNSLHNSSKLAWSSRANPQ